MKNTILIKQAAIRIIKWLVFILFFMLSCEKSEPLFCYKCSTYLRDELLFVSSGCGMDNEHLHTLQVGMQTEAWQILGYDVRVECKRK